MVERFTSKPIELPPADRPFQRSDLIFYGIDHSGPSFRVDVYLDPRGIGEGADRDHRAYVGTFHVLGHGGCFGDVGHCDIPRERDPFDLRPPHQLEPAIRIVNVTEPMRALLERGAETAKVTAVASTRGRDSNKVLAFETIRLATYA